MRRASQHSVLRTLAGATRCPGPVTDGNDPDISILVRSMGRPSLAAALASIDVRQSCTIEIVVVAACGPGHAPLPAFGGPHPLRLIAGSAPLTRPQAANAGLDAARGQWITFLDDDDVFLPGHPSELLAAARRTGATGVVTSMAKAVMSDGTTQSFGRAFAHSQLFERNQVHLSATLFARDLVRSGCRFDPAFDIHEDWDFLLQLAQRAPIGFLAVTGFQWNAEAGDSGAAGGRNHDAERFAAFRDQVYAKWNGARDALVERAMARLQEAGEAAQRGDYAGAHRHCLQALEANFNDPWALNLLAMLQARAGNLAEARATLLLAVSINPEDAGLGCNLAQLDLAAGDVEAARQRIGDALTMDPKCEPALALAARLSERN